MHRTLTNKGRFAVTAMIDLALQSRSGPVALTVIGRRQEISQSYLEQLFGKLRRHALVRATRGPGGGYTLGRKSEEISVADIIVAVAVDKSGESVDRPRKTGSKGDSAGHGMTHDLWSGLNAKLIACLDSVSLKTLVDEQLAKGVSVDDAPPVKRAISLRPVVKPIKVTAPNSVFALGKALSKRRDDDDDDDARARPDLAPLAARPRRSTRAQWAR